MCEFKAEVAFRKFFKHPTDLYESIDAGYKFEEADARYTKNGVSHDIQIKYSSKYHQIQKYIKNFVTGKKYQETPKLLIATIDGVFLLEKDKETRELINFKFLRLTEQEKKQEVWRIRKDLFDRIKKIGQEANQTTFRLYSVLTNEPEIQELNNIDSKSNNAYEPD